MKPLSYSHIDAPYILRICGIVLLCTVLVGYMIFQARNLINGPSITLLEEPVQLQHERTIALHGTSQNVTKLTLNGKPIFTDESGAFSHTLILENGYTIMTMHAEDRYGRTTTLTREFVYVPTTS